MKRRHVFYTGLGFGIVVGPGPGVLGGYAVTRAPMSNDYVSLVIMGPLSLSFFVLCVAWYIPNKTRLLKKQNRWFRSFNRSNRESDEEY